MRWLVAVALALTACEEQSTPVFEDTSCSREVAYYVEGTASSASVTLENSTGNTEQATVDVPMTNTSGSEGLSIGEQPCGTFVYISAQNEDSFGTISCRIEADGVTIEEAESSGAYVIATCSGSVV